MSEVSGDGPIPARILVLGEAPAREEVRQGRPFCGPSGAILWQLLQRQAGIVRTDCRVDNFFPYPIEYTEEGKKKLPTADEVSAQMPRLEAMLEMVDPEFVLTLGLYSTRALLGDWATMEVTHGRPWGTGLRANATVIPCLHPAAGMRNSAFLAQTSEDFRFAGLCVRLGAEWGLEVEDIYEGWEEYHDGCVPRSATPLVAIDTEGTVAHPWCLQWSVGPGQGCRILAQETRKLDQFEAWLRAHRPAVVMHYAVHDLMVLQAMGVDLVGLGLEIHDTMVAAFNLQVEPRGLKALARRWAGMKMRDYREVVGQADEDVCRAYLERVQGQEWPKPEGRRKSIPSRVKTMLHPRAGAEFKPLRTKWREADFRPVVEATVGSMPPLRVDDVPYGEFLSYANRDPDATYRVHEALGPVVATLGLQPVYEMDRRSLPYIFEMESTGMLFDQDAAEVLKDELWQLQCETDAAIRASSGDPELNCGSPDQLADLLFGRLGLPAQRMTKSGKRASTEAGVLEELLGTGGEEADVVLRAVLKRREVEDAYEKVTTFLGAARTQPDSRIRATYKYCTAVSGRLSSENPNILGTPVASKLGKRVRSLFVAPPGRALVSCDLSQIELVITANLSRDRAMMQAFRDGADLHTRTAASLLAVPESEITKDIRYPFKVCNYLVSYGGGGDKLHQEMVKAKVAGYDRRRCDQTIKDWYTLYSGVRDMKAQTYDEMRRDGYVRDFWGRIRYLPGIFLQGRRWPDKGLREEAERQGFNMKIQGFAGGMLRRAMARWTEDYQPALNAAGAEVRALLQFHDEMVVECNEEYAEMVGPVLEECMLADSGLFDVPVKAEWNSGKNWGELK